MIKTERTKKKKNYFVLLLVYTNFAIMKRTSVITKSAPLVLTTGMGCFVWAFFTGAPQIKNTLLLTGLGLIITSVILYITYWKYK